MIFAIALCIGYPVCRRILRGPAAPLLTLMVGMALFGLLVSLLSWLRIFRGMSIAIVGVAAAGVSLHYLRSDLAGWRRRLLGAWPPSIPVLAAFTVLVGALVFFSALTVYPVTAFDATSYHLPLARDLVQNHGLVYEPFDRYSFFPQANESMFAVMLLMSKSVLGPAALEFGMLAVAVLLLPLWFLGSGRGLAGGLTCGADRALKPGADPRRHRPVRRRVDDGLRARGAADRARGRRGTGGAVASGWRWPACCSAKRRRPSTWRSALRCRRDRRSRRGGVLALLLESDPGRRAGFLVIALPWYAWTIHTTGDPSTRSRRTCSATGRAVDDGRAERCRTFMRCRSSARGFTGTSRICSANWQAVTGTRRSPLSLWLGAGFPGFAGSIAAALADLPGRDADRGDRAWR